VAHVAAWRAILSAEELGQSEKFISEELCRDYIASHAALRYVLASCLGVSPHSVQFVTPPVAGSASEMPKAPIIKPKLLFAGDRRNDPGNLRFNLSHTTGAALIGVAVGRELGVDIERHRPLDELHGMARSVMSKPELTKWLAMSPAEQTPGFYNLWTRKEAYLKALGVGLYRNLQEVTVNFSASPLELRSEEAALLEAGSDLGNWALRDIPIYEGYSASVCREGRETFDVAIEDLNICHVSPAPFEAGAHVLKSISS
jgi:4'-phosphopantetheinyl transferase